MHVYEAIGVRDRNKLDGRMSPVCAGSSRTIYMLSEWHLCHSESDISRWHEMMHGCAIRQLAREEAVMHDNEGFLLSENADRIRRALR